MSITEQLPLPWRWLTSPDVFVSYARRDGATYAAGLASELARRKFHCKVDLWLPEPGKTTPAPILRAAKTSKMLVICGTPAALQSQAIEHEIRLFLHGRHQPRVIPVAMTDDIRTARWWPLVQGVHPELEAGDWASGTPSPNVLHRIETTATFTRQDARLKRAAAVAVAVIAAAGLGLGYVSDKLKSTESNLTQRQKELKDKDQQVSQQQGRLKTLGGELTAKAAEIAAATANLTRAEAEASAQQKRARRSMLEASAAQLSAEVSQPSDHNVLPVLSGIRLLSDALSMGAGGSAVVQRGLRDALWNFGYSAELDSPGQKLADAGFTRDGNLMGVTEKGVLRTWSPCAGDTGPPGLSGGADEIPLRFLPGMQQLVVRSGQQLKLRQGASRVALEGFTAAGSIVEIAASPDGLLLSAWRRYGNRLHFWDTATGERLGEPYVSNTRVQAVSLLHESGPLAAIAEGSGAVVLWDPVHSREVGRFKKGNASATEVALSRDATRIAVGHVDGTVRLWRVARPASPVAETKHSGGTDLTGERRFRGDVRAIAFSPKGDRIATGSTDQTSYLLDGTTLRQISQLGGHDSLVEQVAFSEDGSLLLTRDPNVVQVWDTRIGQKVALLRSPSSVRDAQIAPDGATVLTRGNGVIRRWQLGTAGKELYQFGTGVRRASLRTGLDGEQTAELWHSCSEKLVQVLNREDPTPAQLTRAACELLSRRSEYRQVESLCRASTAVVRGQTADPSTAGIAEAIVELTPAQGGSGERYTAQSDDEGRFQFTGVEPGLYTLTAWKFQSGLRQGRWPLVHARPGVAVEMGQAISHICSDHQPRSQIMTEQRQTLAEGTSYIQPGCGLDVLTGEVSCGSRIGRVHVRLERRGSGLHLLAAPGIELGLPDGRTEDCSRVQYQGTSLGIHRFTLGSEAWVRLASGEEAHLFLTRPLDERPASFWFRTFAKRRTQVGSAMEQ